MNNKLVQTGFFDLEEVSSNPGEITIIADWNGLSEEDIEQEASKYHDELDRREQQLKALKSFVEEQEKNVIYEKGMLYAYMKATRSYEKWLEWLKGKNVSRRSADEYIQMAREYKTELSGTTGANRLSRNQVRAIHQTGEGHEILAKVNSGDIKPTWDDINKEINAIKQRNEELEEANRLLQGDFTLFKVQTEQEKEKERQEQQRELDAKEKELQLLGWEKSLQESEYETKLNQNATKISEVEAQLLLIKAEKEQIEQAKMQIIKEDTPETKAKLEELELRIKAKDEKEKKSEEWKKHLLENNEKLAKELQEQRYANEARRKQEQYEFKVKDDCKKSTDSIYQSLKLFASQEPIPRNTRLYSEDEWSRYDQVEQALKHCLEVVARITSARYSNQFIDANTSSNLVIYEDQEANTIDSTPIDQYDEQTDMPPIPIPDPVKPIVGIPDEYLELFTAYQQAVWSNPQPSLLWSASDNNYTDQMKEKEKHMQFTKELLRSGVDRRVRGAQEAMKRTLGIWEGTKV
jgi:hypothetical protein